MSTTVKEALTVNDRGASPTMRSSSAIPVSSKPASLLLEKLMVSLSMVAMGDKAYPDLRAYLFLAFEVSPPPTIHPEILGDVSVLPLAPV
ncbi:hypothetical protein LIER_00626 [Lithospermum erythrorhizon]|uniref:Uncharacterized protein n=1 Tax=Lithospermum erythrorhizon TaxID=34254 RepID=A0AAV3NI31_LITER